MSKHERLLCEGSRITAALSAVQAVGNPPIAPYPLEAALQEVAIPPSRAHGEDTFDAIAKRPVLEEYTTQMTQATLSASLAKLENTVREHISSITALAEGAVVRLSGDTGQARESSPETKVICVIQIVANRALAMTFRSAVFYCALKKALCNCVSEL